MRQKGVTIMRNVYTGFDGEWEKKDLYTNIMLSIQ
jgi:hypothetical protein